MEPDATEEEAIDTGSKIHPLGSVEAASCRYRRDLSPVPRCLAPPGTYREWSPGEGAAHLFLLRRVTSRLISFHFLSLHPRVSIPFGERCLHVCVAHQDIRGALARGKRMSSLLRARTKFPRAISTPPSERQRSLTFDSWVTSRDCDWIRRDG